MANDGTDTPITAKRIFAWWPVVLALAVVLGGYFGFDGRLKTSESGQARIEAQVIALGAKFDENVKAITGKLDGLKDEQGRVSTNLALEQKRDSEKFQERFSAIEREIGFIKGMLTKEPPK